MPIGKADLLDEPVTGTSYLPLSRVKKTIAADEDIQNISAQSTFLISKATELFVRHLADKSFIHGKADNKNKKTLQYKDIASAVSKTDNLEFLSDIVPQTTTWKAHKNKKLREAGLSAPRTEALPAGQSTIDGRRPTSNPVDISMLSEGTGPVAPTTNGTGPSDASGIEFRHYDPKPNGTNAQHDQEGDVEMG